MNELEEMKECYHELTNVHILGIGAYGPDNPTIRARNYTSETHHCFIDMVGVDTLVLELIKDVNTYQEMKAQTFVVPSLCYGIIAIRLIEHLLRRFPDMDVTMFVMMNLIILGTRSQGDEDLKILYTVSPNINIILAEGNLIQGEDIDNIPSGVSAWDTTTSSWVSVPRKDVIGIVEEKIEDHMVKYESDN